MLAPVRGHRMAKAAVEMAVLDAAARRGAGTSFGRYLGAVHERVPAGVSVGIMDSVPQLLDAVDGYLAEGYLRIKLKIEPGWDVEPVRAVRERFGDVPLQVDANTAYTLADAAHLRRLDDFDLLLIEQPLAEEDIRQHGELARLIRTPVCLDESIVSARGSRRRDRPARARQIINIKPGRVGGYLEARRIHDLCRANGIAVWCGGMLETGLGRARQHRARRRCPASPCPVTSRRPTASTPPTSPSRSCSTTVTRWCPTGSRHRRAAGAGRARGAGHRPPVDRLLTHPRLGPLGS